jgi:hypothetical protein
LSRAVSRQSEEEGDMSLGNRQYVERDDLIYASEGPTEVVTSQASYGAPAAVGARASGLALGGVVTILIGIWGGLIPFIGPSFGYSADGATAWEMTSAHLWLAVIPGAVAFVAGLVMLLVAPRTVAGSERTGLVLGGLVSLAAGAWFVIGALAWPVVTTARGYFLTATPLRELGFQAGYGLGPGIVIVLTGAFTLGWSARHQVQTNSVKRPRRGAHSVTKPLGGTPLASGPPVVAQLPVTPTGPISEHMAANDQVVITDPPVLGD